MKDRQQLLQELLQKKLQQPATVSSIPRRTDQTVFPLSFAQERLWFLAQLEPDSPIYNRPLALQLTGTLDVNILQRVLEEILQRHDVLRSRFSNVEGAPLQSILPPGSLTIAMQDLSNLSLHEREQQTQEIVREEAQKPFDLAHDLLIRVLVLRLDREKHILLIVFHHIVFDAWSAKVIIRELSTRYHAFSNGQSSTLPALPIQYADFAHWQKTRLQGKKLETLLAYWNTQLAGAPSVFQLPTDHPRQAHSSYQGKHYTFCLSSSRLKALKALGQQEDATLFMTLFAAFNVVLFRYTGQEDIVIGTPVAGRTRVELEKLIGCFVNTAALRTDLSGNPSFRELLRRVRTMTLEAYTHQDLPFEKLVEELQPERNLNYSPIFQILFNLENFPEPPTENQRLHISECEFDNGIVQLDLIVEFIKKDTEVLCLFNYNTDLFEAATMTRMGEHFQVVLEGVITNPDQRPSDLPLLTEAERRQILVDWNDTNSDFPDDRCVHELFEEQAERTPDAVAVVFREQSLTYRELNKRANQLAHYLRKQGVGPEVLVGICVERSIEMIIGLLGILKAGGAYVPLDPAYPEERLIFLLADSDTSIVLTQKKLADKFPKLRTPVFSLDTDWGKITQGSEKNPDSGAIIENLTYAIYTSGSTGKPKGVLISHKGLRNLVFWHLREFEITATDRVTQLAGQAFDASVWEIWPYLTIGARLYLAAPDIFFSPEALRDWFISNNITISFVPTPLAEELLSLEWPAPIPLRIMLTGGDKLHQYPSVFIPFQVVNNYGPTENSVVSTSGAILSSPQSTATPPIGSPIANTQVYILDHHLKPVPIGVAGKLYLGGAGLARGYQNRTDFTAERFIPNPFSSEPGSRLYHTGDLARYRPDGNIEFLGRCDHQVKLRGLRIELGEIEAALTRHPSLSEAVVILHETSPEEKRLIAYLVQGSARNEQHPLPGTVTTATLRDYLKQTLPEYMIPAVFVVLDALPLTSNGKVDRRALPATDMTRPELEETFVAPRTPFEEIVAEIWTEVLKLDLIGIHDNFFDLGGHSLLASKLLYEIEKVLDIRLPMITIFQSPTIEGLADSIRRQKITTSFYSLFPIQPQGTLPPLFFIYSFGQGIQYTVQGTYGLATRLGKEQPLYGLRYGLAAAQAIEELKIPPKQLETLAEHYLEEIQKIQPQGPYFLCGRSGAGSVAFEMACQLERHGEQVAFLGLLDSLAPGWNTSFRQSFISGIRRWFDRNMGIMAKARDSWYLYQRRKQIHPISIVKFYLMRHRLHSAIRNFQWKPQTFHGKVTLFESEESSAGFPKARHGWEQFAAGGLEVITMPGWHGNMLETEQHVNVMAEKLQACLKLAQEHGEYGATEGIVSWTTSFEHMIPMWEVLGKKHMFETGIVLYGVERDLWMQREAIISLHPETGVKELVIRFESHAPEYLHPITLIFENEQGHAVHTHVVRTPGTSEFELELSRFFQHSEDQYLKFLCDTTFIPHQLYPNNPDTRELGIRILSIKRGY